MSGETTEKFEDQVERGKTMDFGIMLRKFWSELNFDSKVKFYLSITELEGKRPIFDYSNPENIKLEDIGKPEECTIQFEWVKYFFKCIFEENELGAFRPVWIGYVNQKNSKIKGFLKQLDKDLGNHQPGRRPGRKKAV